jgi:hypothetical protein
MAALKEWAVVCKALEEGRQILLLRKGGIMEYKQGFSYFQPLNINLRNLYNWIILVNL